MVDSSWKRRVQVGNGGWEPASCSGCYGNDGCGDMGVWYIASGFDVGNWGRHS